ncbi:unnamed protein product [Caretta caretta]
MYLESTYHRSSYCGAYTTGDRQEKLSHQLTLLFSLGNCAKLFIIRCLLQDNAVIMQGLPASDTSSEKPNPTHQNIGAVQMRIKSANSHHDRHSQSKSMILSENVKVKEPISRHRRNHSQHNLLLTDIISPKEQTVVEKEGYLLKAKIADGGKKLRAICLSLWMKNRQRKNWSTSWIVLAGGKIEFYKESKQPALANLKAGYKPEWVDLCGAQIEWTTEKSSRKNVFQPNSANPYTLAELMEITELFEYEYREESGSVLF